MCARVYVCVLRERDSMRWCESVYGGACVCVFVSNI